MTGARPEWGFVMSIEQPPEEKPASPDQSRGAEYPDNVLPFRKGKAVPRTSGLQHRGEEFFAALSPLLDEADELQKDESPYHETNDFLLLLEENAKLRKLAVRLSNLLGDLPERDARKVEPGSSGDC